VYDVPIVMRLMPVAAVVTDWRAMPKMRREASSVMTMARVIRFICVLLIKEEGSNYYVIEMTVT
jgi:hypothetical protein